MTAKKLFHHLKKMSLASWLVVLIILCGAFFRLYNLRGSLQFQGDQGRDSIIVANMFLKRDFVFIGPVTSVGNMYLGPLYYYFMLPFMFLSFPDPMGPVYAVAILGILTVFLTYKLGKELVSEKAAILAAAFTSFSSVASMYSRFSWNPNPAPIVSLLMIYFVFKAIKHSPKNWILVAVFFSILIQLHYLTLLSAAALGLIWIWQLCQIIRQKNKSDHKPFIELVRATFLAGVVVLLSLVPLVLFDIKHQGLNFKAFQSLIIQKDNFSYSEKFALPEKVAKTVAETEGRSMHILFETNIGKNRQLNRVLYLAVFCALAIKIIKRKNNQYFTGEAIIITFLFTGIIGTAFYQHTIFDHYIAYLFPVTFLIYGMIGQMLWSKTWGKLFVVSFALLFLSYNLPRMPIKTMGWTLDDIKKTSQSILQRVKPGEKYNIVLLSESRDHYGQNYRYFLIASDKPPVEIEQAATAKTLFIINEEKKTSDVVSLPIYDIVVFPNRKPADFFVLENGPEITVLRRESTN